MLRRLAVWVLLLALFGGSSKAEPGTVEEIHVQGLFRMAEDAFLHVLGTRPGDPFDEDKLRRKFREIWDLRLFEDLTLEVETGPKGGQVLVVKVRERPVIGAISYDDDKTLTRTQIEDRYKEREIRLDIGKPLDMGAVFFAESAIRDLLSEKGFLDSSVKAEVRKLTETSRALHFKISPGGKTRIRHIEFVGNTVFSDRQLRGQLKLTRERRWYWPWSSKNLYHPIKWDQDVAAIREAYQNRGYLDLQLRPPVIEVRQKSSKSESTEVVAEPPAAVPVDPPGTTPASPAAGDSAEDSGGVASEREVRRQRKEAERAKKRIEKAERKARKAEAKAGRRWVELTVSISEGEEYRLGEVTFNGEAKFSEPLLRALIPLQSGAVLNSGALDLGVQRITRLYEDAGHLYANVVRTLKRREVERVADVSVEIDEDRPYLVGRIEFLGNSATRDAVLRREMLLVEGDQFSRTLLEQSRRKIEQLGYFQLRGEPVIEPAEGQQSVRVLMAGEEAGRNEIQVGGGYSGLEGAFFNGVYSTRNFLGRGQILSLAMQLGGRADRYQISFTEPWFLNRAYLLGLSLFRRDTDYGATLRSTSEGLGVVLGKRLTRNARLDVGYSYERVSSTSVAFNLSDALLRNSSQTTISAMTPVFAFNTINNPYRPTRGRLLNLSTQVAGGPLGGESSYLKPVLSYTQYRRGFGPRSYLGFHAEAGWVGEFGDSRRVDTTTIEGVPRFQRFWLGGDTLGPRVFETRTITPRRYVELDDEGNIVALLGDPRYLSPGDLVTSGGVPVLVEVGGNRMYLVQSEFVIAMNEQAEVAFFMDAGDAPFDDTDIGFDTLRVSAGVELRFHLPIFPVPLRLIYGLPIRKLEGDRTSSFTFSIGRSF